MAETMNGGPEFRRAEPDVVAPKLEVVGWGLFFMWAGVAFLGSVPSGVAVFGVGVITLGMQLTRRMYRLSFQGFWVVMGCLFVIAGLCWEELVVGIPLIPILFLAAGAALLWSVYRGQHLMKHREM